MKPETDSDMGDIPGTTRDAIDTLVDFDGRSVLLIDTAGIRRRGRVEVGVEKYSVIRALRAIDRADVVLLVMDAGETDSRKAESMALENIVNRYPEKILDHGKSLPRPGNQLC